MVCAIIKYSRYFRHNNTERTIGYELLKRGDKSSFAHRLHMKTVAEGVETKEQLAFLRTCDCSKIQGYLLARPMNEKSYFMLCQSQQKIEEPVDILQLQTPASAGNLLLEVIFRRFPLVIFTNLTRNTFYMMVYQDFTRITCPSTGVFDEFIVHGAASMHRELFASTFDRKRLIEDFKAGMREKRLITRQLGDDGVYRRVETVDYFIDNNSSDDILVITLCENLPD